MMWKLLLSVCVVVAAFRGSNAASYTSLGCWADTGNRAIATLEGTDPRLDGGYGGRANAIEKCFQVALSRGFPVFAIQDGGWCAGSADGLNTYDMYGPATNCGSDGEGGGWANEVYKITYCDIDVVFVADVSASIQTSGFSLIKDYIKGFAQCFTEPQDVNVGVIAYDCAPRRHIALGEFPLGDPGLDAAVDSLVHTRGLSRTGRAVHHMMYTSDFRAGAPWVAVILTDGNAQDDINLQTPDDYAAQCGMARTAGIEFYSVAIGNPDLLDTVAMETIAGAPDRVITSTDPCDLAKLLVAEPCVVCSGSPLGVESGVIPDGSITASSYLAAQHEPYLARLNSIAGIGAWAAANNNIWQWLQVDLGELKRVGGVITQGRYISNQYVTSYKLQYSADGASWTTYPDSGGGDKVFPGNTDDDTPVTNLLTSPVDARYVRFLPQSWYRWIVMRVEVLGC